MLNVDVLLQVGSHCIPLPHTHSAPTTFESRVGTQLLEVVSLFTLLPVPSEFCHHNHLLAPPSVCSCAASFCEAPHSVENGNAVYSGFKQPTPSTLCRPPSALLTAKTDNNRPKDQTDVSVVLREGSHNANTTPCRHGDVPIVYSSFYHSARTVALHPGMVCFSIQGQKISLGRYENMHANASASNASGRSISSLFWASVSSATT